MGILFLLNDIPHKQFSLLGMGVIKRELLGSFI